MLLEMEFFCLGRSREASCRNSEVFVFRVEGEGSHQNNVFSLVVGFLFGTIVRGKIGI